MAKTIHIHLHDFAGAGFRTQRALRTVTKDISPRRYWTLRVVWKNGEVDNYNFETESEARAAKRSRSQVEAIEKLILKRPDGMVVDAETTPTTEYRGFTIHPSFGRPEREFYIRKNGKDVFEVKFKGPTSLSDVKRKIDEYIATHGTKDCGCAKCAASKDAPEPNRITMVTGATERGVMIVKTQNGKTYLVRATETGGQMPKVGAVLDPSKHTLKDAKARDMQQAYKGYLIKTGLRPDEYYISKDGQHIGTASTLQAAKQIIDQIADD